MFTFLLIFVFGCAHTHHLPQDSPADEFSEVNKKLSNKEVAIFLADDSRQIEAKNVHIAPDSVSYLDIRTDNRSRIATHNVNKIIHAKYGKGALEGFGLGVLAGSAIFGSSILIALSHGDNSEAAGFERLGILATGLALGGIAVFISPFVGAAKGSQDIYILNPASSSDNANP